MSIARGIQPASQRTPESGWKFDLPYLPYINFRFPEDSNIAFIRIQISDVNQFSFYIRPKKDTSPKNLEPILQTHSANQAVQTQPLDKHGRFITIKGVEALTKLLNDLRANQLLPEEIFNELKSTLQNSVILFQEYTPSYELLRDAYSLGTNEKNPEKLSEADLYEKGSDYYREEINKLTEAAVDEELVGFFRYRPEFSNPKLKLKQFALEQALKKGKIESLTFLATGKESFSMEEIKLAFKSKNKDVICFGLARVKVTDSNFEHEILLLAAATNKDVLEAIREQSKTFSLQRHLSSSNTECAHCRAGFTLLNTALIWRDKFNVVEYLCTDLKLSQEEWDSHIRLANTYCGLKMENTLRHFQNPDEVALELSLPMLFRYFSTPNLRAESLQEIIALIEEREPDNDSLQMLALDATVLADMLFYYSSKYAANPDKLKFLLDHNPSAIHVVDHKGDPLLWNEKTNPKNLGILQILIAHGADPYLANSSGESLLSYLERNKHNRECEDVSDSLIRILLFHTVALVKDTLPLQPHISAMILDYIDEKYRSYFLSEDEEKRMVKDFEELIESLFENPSNSGDRCRQLLEMSYQLSFASKAARIVSEKLNEHLDHTFHSIEIRIGTFEYITYQKVIAATQKICKIFTDNHLNVDGSFFGKLPSNIQSWIQIIERKKPEQNKITLHEVLESLLENPKDEEQVNKFKDLVKIASHEQISKTLGDVLHCKIYRRSLIVIHETTPHDPDSLKKYQKILQKFQKIEVLFSDYEINISDETLELIKTLRAHTYKPKVAAKSVTESLLSFLRISTVPANTAENSTSKQLKPGGRR